MFDGKGPCVLGVSEGERVEKCMKESPVVILSQRLVFGLGNEMHMKVALPLDKPIFPATQFAAEGIERGMTALPKESIFRYCFRSTVAFDEFEIWQHCMKGHFHGLSFRLCNGHIAIL